MGAAKAAKAAQKKASVAAASGAGMWMLVGSIGVLCVCAVYVMTIQHWSFCRREDALTKMEKAFIKEKYGINDEEMDELEEARREAAEITELTGEKVCGVYP